MQRIQVIDSHTEGEPTRVVIAGCPDLGPGDAAERMEIFRQQHGWLRSALIHEPRGFDAMVGALLLEPRSPKACGQMIFFNNADTLHMCGHGTIGVAATLAHLGRLQPGTHILESPPGDVEVTLHDDHSVSVANVFSYRWRKAVAVDTEYHGRVVGDIAWGGNWFFLIGDHGQALDTQRIDALTAFSWDVRQSLNRAGITGKEGGEIDHVELFAEPNRPDADSRNFVLCPGKEYDRSPCGTGTSAKMACLAADGKLDEGQIWRQESLIGSLFTGSVRHAEQDGIAGVMPTVRGRAWITAESTLLLDPTDPFEHGIRL